MKTYFIFNYMVQNLSITKENYKKMDFEDCEETSGRNSRQLGMAY